MSSTMDNQGRWYELLSRTQVLTGQQKTTQNVNISLDSNYITEDEEEVTMNTEEIPLKYHLKVFCFLHSVYVSVLYVRFCFDFFSHYKNNFYHKN